MFLLKYTSLFSLSKNSELKAKFLFKNKATNNSKNVVSLGGNVDWVCLVGNVVVGECIGDTFSWVKMLWVSSVSVGVCKGGNVAVGGNVVVVETLRGNIAVGVSLGRSAVVGISLGANVVVDGIVAMDGSVAVGVTMGGNVLVRVSLGVSIDVGVSLSISDVVGGNVAMGGNVAVGVALGVIMLQFVCV